jgi:hypothetical protein
VLVARLPQQQPTDQHRDRDDRGDEDVPLAVETGPLPALDGFVRPVEHILIADHRN